MTINRPDNYVQHDLKKDSLIKQIIGKPGNRQSTAWYLKGNKKGDVYIFAKSAGGEWKISIHKDRNCHFGFTSESKEYAKERFGLNRRHLEQWKLQDGPIVHAVSFIVPESELANTGVKSDKTLTWIDEPPKGMAVIVTLHIEETNLKTVNLNLPPHIKLLATIETKSRRSYLSYRYSNIDSAMLEIVNTTKEEARKKLLDESAIDPTDKLRVFVPITVGVEHAFIEVDI